MTYAALKSDKRKTNGNKQVIPLTEV